MASFSSTLAIFLILQLTVSSSSNRVSFPLTYVDYSIPIPESGKILLPTGKCEDIRDRDLSLYLAGCAPVTLYPGFIDSCRVTCLCLSDSSISQISVGSFDKLPNLEYLDLSRNRIQLCDFLSFGGHNRLVTLIVDENDSGLKEQVLSQADCFPKLEHLYLRKNNIADITIPLQRTFPSLTHLYLHLERNRISRLDTRGLINLSSLFLDGNRIQSLSHLPCSDDSNLSLRHTSRLRFLSLSQNLITSVQRDSFDDCRALKSLNLAHNRISSIPSGTFDCLSELRDLSLSYNQLTSLPDFRNVRVLTSLSLDHNLIEYIPTGAFCDLRELKWLSLGNNRIKNVFVEAFVNLNSLEEIDLSFNELTYLPYGWIRGSTRLKHLDVRGNRFTRIEDLALDCTVSLKYLYLQGNPLDRYTPG